MAAAVGRELLDLAEQQEDAGLQVEGHLVVDPASPSAATFRAAWITWIEPSPLFDPHQHRPGPLRLGPSPGVVPYTTSAFLAWLLGYPDRAVERAAGAVDLARQLNHPFTLACTLFHVGSGGASWSSFTNGRAVCWTLPRSTTTRSGELSP